jgi:hypothetical protein
LFCCVGICRVKKKALIEKEKGSPDWKSTPILSTMTITRNAAIFLCTLDVANLSRQRVPASLSMRLMSNSLTFS